jgi:hypothetical protein
VSAVNDQDVAGPMRRIDDLVRSLETCPDMATRESARELVRTVLDLHAAGLAKLLELASQAGDSGRDLVQSFAREPLVSSLLLLHGLHPVPVERRVADAVENVLAGLRSHEGKMELLAVTEEIIRIRLRGDPSTGPALRLAVEEALTQAAADVPNVEIEEAWDPDPAGRLSLPLVAGRGVE